MSRSPGYCIPGSRMLEVGPQEPPDTCAWTYTYPLDLLQRKCGCLEWSHWPVVSSVGSRLPAGRFHRTQYTTEHSRLNVCHRLAALVTQWPFIEQRRNHFQFAKSHVHFYTCQSLYILSPSRPSSISCHLFHIIAAKSVLANKPALYSSKERGRNAGRVSRRATRLARCSSYLSMSSTSLVRYASKLRLRSTSSAGPDGEGESTGW